MKNLLGKLLLRCSTSCIHAVVHGRDSSPKSPDLSLHSYHYAPQSHAVFDSLSSLLATIPISPTDSYICSDCQKECEKHAKHAQCKACGEACAACVKECRKHLKT